MKKFLPGLTLFVLVFTATVAIQVATATLSDTKEKKTGNEQTGSRFRSSFCPLPPYPYDITGNYFRCNAYRFGPWSKCSEPYFYGNRHCLRIIILARTYTLCYSGYVYFNGRIG